MVMVSSLLGSAPILDLDIEFEVPTWDQIYEMLLRLAVKIRGSNFHPDLIVGIGRGGWLPARVMSDLLGNPRLSNMTVESYLGVGETRKETTITQSVSAPVKDLKLLILDDCADTGKSLKIAREHLSEKGPAALKIATIYCKPWSTVVPDYYEKETSCWIVFPWERWETVKNLVRKFSKDEVLTKLVTGGMDQSLAERFINEVNGADR